MEKDNPVRLKIAELAHESTLQRTDDPRRAEAAKEKVLAPPYIVYVYCVPGPNEETTKENYRVGLLRSSQHGVGRCSRGVGRDLGNGWGYQASAASRVAGRRRGLVAGDHALDRLPG